MGVFGGGRASTAVLVRVLWCVWLRYGDEILITEGYAVYLEPADIHKLRATSITTPLQDHYDGRLSVIPPSMCNSPKPLLNPCR